MIKVMTIFGTRPEAIKMAPLVKELESRKEIESIVCVTAQHREMLDQVLSVFDIKPNYDLNIMKVGQTLSEITSRVLLGLEEIIKKEKPNIILVHGDTTTTFAGALAAFYNNVDIGHVEAGLRTWNKYSPFPEEMNRQMVDRMTDMFFAPTEVSKNNLLKEDIPKSKIYITGNTAIDAMEYTVNNDYKNELFDWLEDSKFILLTAHRRENLGDPMYNIFRAVNRIVEENCDVKVIYPIHMNPKIREIAKLIQEALKRWWLIGICTVLCGAVFFTYSNFFIDEMYTSNAKIYTDNKATEVIDTGSIDNNTANLYDLTTAEMLVDTYIEILEFPIARNSAAPALYNAKNGKDTAVM